MSSDTGHGTAVTNTADAPVGAPTTSVADVMRAQAFWVDPQRTVAEVARVLLTRNVQSVIVVDDQRVMGLVSWHDLLGAVLPGVDVLMQADAVPDLAALLALSREHAHVPVAQIMRPIAFTTFPDTSATRALTLMLRSHVPLLPVVDRSGRLVGILTLRELLSAVFVPETPRAAGHS
jgi:CBS domain-containing protein